MAGFSAISIMFHFTNLAPMQPKGTSTSTYRILANWNLLMEDALCSSFLSLEGFLKLNFGFLFLNAEFIWLFTPTMENLKHLRFL